MPSVSPGPPWSTSLWNRNVTPVGFRGTGGGVGVGSTVACGLGWPVGVGLAVTPTFASASDSSTLGSAELTAVPSHPARANASIATMTPRRPITVLPPPPSRVKLQTLEACAVCRPNGCAGQDGAYLMVTAEASPPN